MQLKEDQPGQSPPGVDGKREENFFDANRGDHLHKMRLLELGAVGRLLGGEKNAPISIAFILAIVGSVAAVGCLVAAGVTKDSAWSQMFERCIAFLGVISAYIFGRGSRE